MRGKMLIKDESASSAVADELIDSEEGEDSPTAPLGSAATSRVKNDLIKRCLISAGISLPAKGKALEFDLHLIPLAAKLKVECSTLGPTKKDRTKALRDLLYEKLTSADNGVELSLTVLDELDPFQQGQYLHIPSELRARPLSIRVRRSFLRATSRENSASWRLLDPTLAISQIPPLDEDTIRYFLATPTVSLADSIHSATYDRSSGFADGDSDYSSLQIRYAADKDHVVLTNQCRASMSSGIWYRAMVAFTFPSPRQGTLTMKTVKDGLACFCTCKNGECGGNCAHIASLLRRVGQLQGTIILARSSKSEHIASTVYAPEHVATVHKMENYRKLLPHKE